VPIGSPAYDRRRLRLLAREVLGPDVLDIGYAQLPNPHLRQFRTVGLDLARPKQPSGYAEEIVGDAMNLAAALGARQFHSIVCGDIIEHLEAPYAFLRSLHPFLAGGGRLVLSTPNPLGFPQALFEFLGSRRFYYTEEHMFSFLPRWVAHMLQVTGFRLAKTRPVGLNLLLFVPWCPTFMSYDVVYVAEPRQNGKERSGNETTPA